MASAGEVHLPLQARVGHCTSGAVAASFMSITNRTALPSAAYKIEVRHLNESAMGQSFKTRLLRLIR